MVVTTLLAKARIIAGALATAGIFIAATPASANSSANADIAAPLRAAQEAGQSVSGSEDEQFRSLFSKWQTFESNAVPALAAVAEAADEAGRTSSATRFVSIQRESISIPSRAPLQAANLTSDFGMRTHPVSGGRRAHKGIDLAAPTGTPVYATADGIISRASWYSSYGLYVSIEHGGDMQTRYAHLSRLNVAQDQRVKKGEIIGFVGSTGRSTGPHLHYEVRVRGEAVNPIPYMVSDRLAHAGS